MTFPIEHAERILDELIAERVVAAVDVHRIRDLEHMLGVLLGDIEELSDDQVHTLARQAIDRALGRIPDYVRNLNDDCPLCRQLGEPSS
ncbi:MAG TPA: hypothetical protein VGO00_17265 [Kofleriaceae bacterium]|nr:hypothetical protein [Kofleriaceae bacterium]